MDTAPRHEHSEVRVVTLGLFEASVEGDDYFRESTVRAYLTQLGQFGFGDGEGHAGPGVLDDVPGLLGRTGSEDGNGYGANALDAEIREDPVG